MISENDLRNALRRREAPAGFVERALAGMRQVSPEDSLRGNRRQRSWTPYWIASSIAATVLLTISVERFVSYERELAAKAAARDLTLALRITGEKLHDVQLKVAANTQRGEDQQ